MDIALPEIENLAQAAKIIAGAAADTELCAQLLMEMRVTTDAELQARWKPIVEEGIQEVLRAGEVLHAARERMQAVPRARWSRAEPDKSTLTALVRTAQALHALVSRLECARADTGARDLVVRVRGTTIAQLPPAQRRVLLARGRTARSKQGLTASVVMGIALGAADA